MPRLRHALRAALPSVVLALVALLAAGALLSCTGSGDPTSAPVDTESGTYVHATITLLDDTSDPCIPGAACNPEMRACDGVTGITVPRTWIVDANSVTAGAFSYNDATPTSAANGTLVVRGNDTARDTGVSVAISFGVDAAAGSLVGAAINTGGQLPAATFANMDTRCTQINGANDPITLFGILIGQPNSATLDGDVTAGGDLAFAVPDGAGLTAQYVSGTFSFFAQNLQNFGGQAILATVRVDGCFRVQMPRYERGVPVDPAASPACP